MPLGIAGRRSPCPPVAPRHEVGPPHVGEPEAVDVGVHRRHHEVAGEDRPVVPALVGAEPAVEVGPVQRPAGPAHARPGSSAIRPRVHRSTGAVSSRSCVPTSHPCPRRSCPSCFHGGLSHLLLAVDPVPWARAQMAFTLGAHIILVPLGVSWAFMILIANYRGIKHGDADALEARAAVVEIHGGDVRGRCRHRHRAHVRVRPAVARVHGPLRRRLRHPLRDRGPVLLPRGDLHRHLHLRLEAPPAVGALLDAASRS